MFEEEKLSEKGIMSEKENVANVEVEQEIKKVFKCQNCKRNFTCQGPIVTAFLRNKKGIIIRCSQCGAKQIPNDTRNEERINVSVRSK